MSLLEVLIATAVMLVIALSILPLLLRSLANNHRGAEATQVSAFATAQLDELLQMPFDKGSLVIGDGVSEKAWVERQLLSAAVETPQLIAQTPNERWQTDDATAGEVVQWERSVQIQQFSLSDIEADPVSGISSLDTPLTGNTAAELVHLKQVEVRVRGGREAGALGAGQDLTIRVLKAY